MENVTAKAFNGMPTETNIKMVKGVENPGKMKEVSKKVKATNHFSNSVHPAKKSPPKNPQQKNSKTIPRTKILIHFP